MMKHYVIDNDYQITNHGVQTILNGPGPVGLLQIWVKPCKLRHLTNPPTRKVLLKNVKRKWFFFMFSVTIKIKKN